jgi:3-methyladenine DNA glycosylase AlkD
MAVKLKITNLSSIKAAVLISTRSLNPYIESLRALLQPAGDASIAEKQKKYMRSKFEFAGLPSPLLQKVMRHFLAEHGMPPPESLGEIIRELWDQPEREFQYAGMQLLDKMKKEFGASHLGLLEFMITQKSWWDTIDFIAANLVGTHLQRFPTLKTSAIESWMASQNIWLQRTALIFQLKYKHDTDTELLFDLIERLSGSDEFFIRKAIGWALREYSKTNPMAVIKFANSHQLKPLSRKEALRRIDPGILSGC